MSILLELELESNHTFEEDKSAFAWMVKILRPDIQRDTDLPHGGSINSLLTSAIESGNVEIFRFILDAFVNYIESRATELDPNLLVECVHHGQYAMARCLIQRGANLHAEGYNPDCGEMWIDATFRALFSSAAFFEWRKLLREQNVDLDEFIVSANKQPLWIWNGWQSDTLRKLFDLDFEPIPQPALGKCPNFNSSEDCVNTFVELSWQGLIDRIILREDLIGVFEGYPISNDSELASEQTCTEKNPDANQEEIGSQSEGEGNAPTLKPDLK